MHMRRSVCAVAVDLMLAAPAVQGQAFTLGPLAVAPGTPLGGIGLGLAAQFTPWDP